MKALFWLAMLFLATFNGFGRAGQFVAGFLWTAGFQAGRTLLKPPAPRRTVRVRR